jgi:acetyl esterase/lipase
MHPWSYDRLDPQIAAVLAAAASSGTPVIHRCEEGMIHGFVGFTGNVERASSALRYLGTSLHEAVSFC